MSEVVWSVEQHQRVQYPPANCVGTCRSPYSYGIQWHLGKKCRRSQKVSDPFAVVVKAESHESATDGVPGISVRIKGLCCCGGQSVCYWSKASDPDPILADHFPIALFIQLLQLAFMLRVWPTGPLKAPAHMSIVGLEQNVRKFTSHDLNLQRIVDQQWRK